MTPMVAPGQLAALCDGRPKLILLPGVAAPEALALPGLAQWALAADGLLHPPGAPAGDPGIPLRRARPGARHRRAEALPRRPRCSAGGGRRRPRPCRR
ncbi:hypothetical protein [Dankookia sp. P2]|uniref:hypothetical protein n=1 Tax=Dankookia sp. P2 TaxID=3423955 RepID=UPI003D669B8E